MVSALEGFHCTRSQLMAKSSYHIRSLCTEILREVEKKSKHKARFEPATFCSAHTESPNHYTTAVVNHYFYTPFIETNPRPATIGNPSPTPPIHTIPRIVNYIKVRIPLCTDILEKFQQVKRKKNKHKAI